MRRNNHYNSQMYLKEWECEKNKAMVYELLVSNEKVPLWRKVSIENLCSIDSLFVRLKNKEETDDIEQWFNEKYETPAMKPLNKARRGEKLTHDDIDKIVDFIACEIVRAPAFIERILKIGKSEGKKILESELTNIKKMKKEYISRNYSKNKKEYNNEMFPTKITMFNNNTKGEKISLKAETIIGKQFYLWIMKWLLENTAEVLHKHKWRIITVHENVKLPTSDDPVICLNYNNENDYNFGGGWGRENGNILFPISSNKIIYTQIGSENITDLNVDYKTSRLFKKMIIEHAHMQIISSYEDVEVQNIRKRVVDCEEFKKEKEKWKKFQENYLKDESRYIK